MRLDLKFRHTPHSDELAVYVEERCQRLEKFERKPVKVEFTFTAQKQTCRVDISIRGKGIDVHAHHESTSFFDSVDHAIDKVSRQMERKKSARAHQRRPKGPLALPMGYQPEEAPDAVRDRPRKVS